MSRILNRRNALLAFFAMVVLPALWWIGAGPWGSLNARYDVARGHYTIHDYGLPTLAFPEYQRLLRERYDVEVKAMGCIFPSTSYDSSYDRVVIDAVNRKFGHDVFKEAWEQADKDWDVKRKAEMQHSSHSE